MYGIHDGTGNPMMDRSLTSVSTSLQTHLSATN